METWEISTAFETVCSGFQANVFRLSSGATKSVSSLAKGRGDVSGSSPPSFPREEMDAFCPLKKAVLGLVMLFEGKKKGERQVSYRV